MGQRNECQRRRLKMLRKAKGTQRKVSFELGITETHYRELENGKSVPGTKLLFKMANYFEVSVYDIFPDLNEPSFYDSNSN